METARWRGLNAGLIAGLATTAAMYVAATFAGIQPLPSLLQEPVLELLPGPVFGFLIDNLQHAGKVLEEAGLVVAMVCALAALGALYGRLGGSARPHLGLYFGGLAWGLVCLVLLPLSGDGLLGLNEGVTAPLVWALLFLVYGTVLDLAYGAERLPDAADEGRRRALGLLPLGIGLASLGVLGVRLVPGWVQAIAAPPEAGLRGATPALTPVANFYVVSKNFSDPIVSERGWALSVHGLVDSPFKLSYADLTGLPATTEIVTLECISNNVGGPQISTNSFTGVPLRDLVAKAGPQSSARALNFRSRDGYTESLALSLVRDSPEILVAHQMGGRPLPDAHGFPARILIPGHYGMKGPKWLEDIEVAAAPGGGYWEGQGWNPDAAVRTGSRIDSPGEGDVLPAGEVLVAGIAFAGKRGIQAVEWSADGGRTWRPADLAEPLSALAWTLWTATWRPPGEGAYTLVVRARDGEGALQSPQVMPSFPNGSGGYHKVRVSVSR